MDKRYLSPLELLTIGTQHAYAADHLLQQHKNNEFDFNNTFSILAPITSLLYQAFQLTLKAYSLHEHRPIKEYKKLMELVEMNSHLCLSNQDIGLLKALSKQQAFHKGSDYEMWDNQQQLHVFCENIINLYQRLQQMMPLELHPDYQK